MKILVIISALPLLATAQTQTWTPYTAKYTERTALIDSNGRQRVTVKNLLAYRAADGSTANFDLLNGTPVGGELWLSCGSFVKLKYGLQTASVSKRPARHRIQIPAKDQPIGTLDVAGVVATGWPVHVANGNGSIWIDVPDDIVVKLEIHLNQNGVRQDYVKLIQTLELNTTVPPDKFNIPAGFKSETRNNACGG